MQKVDALEVVEALRKGQSVDDEAFEAQCADREDDAIEMVNEAGCDAGFADCDDVEILAVTFLVVQVSRAIVAAAIDQRRIRGRSVEGLTDTQTPRYIPLPSSAGSLRSAATLLGHRDCGREVPAPYACPACEVMGCGTPPPR